jgi:hypothetical protein
MVRRAKQRRNVLKPDQLVLLLQLWDQVTLSPPTQKDIA